MILVNINTRTWKMKTKKVGNWTFLRGYQKKEGEKLLQNYTNKFNSTIKTYANITGQNPQVT